MTHRKIATDMIIQLQEKKRPFDEARSDLWVELSSLLETVSIREQEIRQEIKAIQDDIKPMDSLMCEVDQAGNLKSESGAMMLLNSLKGQI